MERRGVDNMRRIIDKNEKGFTLAELLIVVAIIAVLVAVSIPIFTSQLEKARAATCMANRRALYGELSASYMTDEGNYKKPDLDKYTCPSKGNITYSEKDGIFTVECSVHTKKWNDNTVPDLYDLIFKDYVGSTVDSTAVKNNNTNADKLEAVKKALAEKGIDLDALGAASWRVTGDAGAQRFEWSTVDISKVNVGQTIPVIRYRFDGTYGKMYSVWLYTVGEGVGGGYNVIKTQGKEIPASASASAADKESIDNIIEIYNKYVSTQKIDNEPIPTIG